MNGKFLLSALATVAAIVFQFGAIAQAQQCRLERVGRDTRLILFDADLRYDDSYGTDYGGHNFSVGYASCDGYNAPIEKQRPNGEGNMVLRIDGSYQNCTVYRSRNWQSKRYDCSQWGGNPGHGGGGNRRDVRSRIIEVSDRNSSYYSFDGWNYYYRLARLGAAPSPESIGLDRQRDARLLANMNIDQWCGLVRRAGINCYAPAP